VFATTHGSPIKDFSFRIPDWKIKQIYGIISKERKVSKMKTCFGISNDPDDRSEDVKEPK